ncbi:unnamed protein product [Hymenolepis diminuta]|uniref:Uncharacterized protein n=1 Tax=Hymenolepis diminuta TaxID=6216 RepID=A0A0R3SPS0_HYMDI|nr:unnamed protein product [Hymenolepis diminuta]
MVIFIAIIGVRQYVGKSSPLMSIYLSIPCIKLRSVWPLIG